MQLMEIMNLFRPYLFGFSGIMTALVLIISARLAFDVKKASTNTNKKIVILICIALIASSMLFFNNILGVWALSIVVGFLVLASVFTSKKSNIDAVNEVLDNKNQNKENNIEDIKEKKKNYRYSIIENVGIVLSLSFVSLGIIGVYSGYAPIVSMGPSMWPSSSKGISVNIINANAYKYKNIDYGDKISFEVREDASDIDAIDSWPLGRYGKRVWALPGDEIEIRSNYISLNGEKIADCSNMGNEIAPRVWWCTAKFPNGVEKRFVWGFDNAWFELVKNKYKLKQDEIFVIGDNTVESSDSRERGPIKISWVEGRYQSEKQYTEWKKWGT